MVAVVTPYTPKQGSCLTDAALCCFIVRRKVTPTHTSNLVVPNGQAGFSAQRVPSEISDDESDGEMDESFEWNWRDDSK